MHEEPNSDAVTLPLYTLELGHAPTAEQVAWLGEGDFCDCYLVNEQYVFRFAKHAAASASMAVERCLLPLLQPYLTVSIPQFTFAGHSTDSGEAMVGYLSITGAPLEGEVLARLPVAAQAALIAQMATFARQLHRVPLAVVRACGIPTREPLAHLTGLMEAARVEVALQLSEAVWHYYESLFAHYCQTPALHTYTPALLHGDLSPNHFFATPAHAQLTGVIDFGDVCIGDPAWDFIYLYEDYPPSVLPAFLAHYDPENAALLEQKVRLYQHLNNVEYALSALQADDADEIAEALEILEAQANEPVL
jgi:aminoglycoside 2''-phosphotransferase